MVQKTFERWLQHPNLDPSYQMILKGLTAAEKHDAFYTNIEFGTAGMRGLLGPGTNRINLHTIRKANAGFSEYISTFNEQAKKRGVAIGYDNRHMSYEFAIDSAKLLASYGITTYVFESLRPTPELSFALRHFHCFGGIMITASHNPKEYNGYKLYDETGSQLIPQVAKEVIARVNAIQDELAITYQLNAQQEKLIHYIGKEVDERYYENVLSIQMHPELSKDKLKIVFSPEHGTANIPVKEIYKRAGYNMIPVIEQCDPDPDFKNTPTPNPEEKGAYELALQYARKNDADIILICDPDADRMGVGVKHQGEYHLLSGNQSGSILIEYICSQLYAQKRMPPNAVMLNTVVTSDLGEKIADKYQVETIKTLTGFKFIGEKIEEYQKTNSKSYIFGYEESYGSLIKPFVRDKDAQQACLLLAEAACFYAQKKQTLCDVLNGLYEELGYYEETQVSLTLKGEEGALKIRAILEQLREHQPQAIADTKVIKIEDYLRQEVHENHTKTNLKGFDSADVLKYYLADGSWIAIRPSGTEPKCKFYYCVKGKSMQDAKNQTQCYQEAMKQYML